MGRPWSYNLFILILPVMVRIKNTYKVKKN
jgi:hypothetical protein